MRERNIGEIRTITTCDNPPMRIMINPHWEMEEVPYFRVYNYAIRSQRAEFIRVARLHIMDEGMEYQDDGYEDWILAEETIEKIQNALLEKDYYFRQYTHWQMLCYYWNLEKDIFDTQVEWEDYFAGKLDEKYIHNPCYVPGRQKMPHTWWYHPCGVKRKKVEAP